jgi:hypothetical protein
VVSDGLEQALSGNLAQLRGNVYNREHHGKCNGSGPKEAHAKLRAAGSSAAVSSSSAARDLT